MADRLYYNKKSNSWHVYVLIEGKEKIFSYTISKYGKYTKKLAEQSLKNKKRYENFIEIFDTYSILYINTKNYGYKEVYIDVEDASKVSDTKWTYNNGYAYSFYYGAMHRYILGLERSPGKKQDKVVDHINRDTLDNRKNNLRVTNNSGNQRNKGIQSNNTSGITGVRLMSTKTGVGWIASINTISGETKTKFFGLNKYGDENAKELAIQWRKTMMKENNYILCDKRSTTIESIT